MASAITSASTMLPASLPHRLPLAESVGIPQGACAAVVPWPQLHAAHSQASGRNVIATTLTLDGVSGRAERFLHHVSDQRSHLDDQEGKYASCLRYLEDHPSERAHWEPQLVQLRRELDDLRMRQMEYGKSAVNMSGHVEELAECMQRKSVHVRSPGFLSSPGSFDAAELRAQVNALVQGTRAAEAEAMAAKAAVETVKRHFMSTVTEFRAEVLHLKCSFEKVVDTTKQALAEVSEVQKRCHWDQLPEDRDDRMQDILEKLKAENAEAAQELFSSLWEDHSAALIRKQEEAHEKLTALVAHVVGEQVVNVSGAALAMALRKDVDALRLENEQLQKQVAQMTGQLHTQIEDLEMRTMLQESARQSAAGLSLASEMQRHHPCSTEYDALGREVNAMRDEIASLCQQVYDSSLREEVEVMKRSIANEKKFRGLTRLECDEINARLEAEILEIPALREEFEQLKRTGMVVTDETSGMW